MNPITQLTNRIFLFKNKNINASDLLNWNRQARYGMGIKKSFVYDKLKKETYVKEGKT